MAATTACRFFGGWWGALKLHYRVLECLHHWSDQVLDWAGEPIFSSMPLVMQLISVLKLLLHHLEFISATFCAMQLVVCEFQRVSLELCALLDYQEFYQLQMDTNASFGVNTEFMGASTNDLAECSALFCTAIPVWLIRPPAGLFSIRVKALAPLQLAHGTIPLDPLPGPACPKIYSGPANCLEKYIAIAQYVSQLLQFLGPFGSVQATPPPSVHGIGTASSWPQQFTPCNTPHSFPLLQ